MNKGCGPKVLSDKELNKEKELDNKFWKLVSEFIAQKLERGESQYSILNDLNPDPTKLIDFPLPISESPSASSTCPPPPLQPAHPGYVAPNGIIYSPPEMGPDPTTNTADQYLFHVPP